MHLVERDCKFAMFWQPDQGKCTYYASIILDSQEHLLFPKLSIIYQGLEPTPLVICRTWRRLHTQDKQFGLQRTHGLKSLGGYWLTEIISNSSSHYPVMLLRSGSSWWGWFLIDKCCYTIRQVVENFHRCIITMY